MTNIEQSALGVSQPSSALTPSTKPVNKSATPEELRQIAKLDATGLRFINGVASSYDQQYPEALEGLLSRRDFDEAIDHVNNMLVMYWPCNTCFFFGYVCSVCSLGLSLGCPNVCIAAAEKNARGELEYLNRTGPFREVGMIWSLKKTCFASWIIIQVPASVLAKKQQRGASEA